jgi:hypothetical protein
MLRIGFTLNGHQQFAYYSGDELVVVATEIQARELPETLKKQLSEYKGIVTQVYELDKNKVREYCALIESPSKRITLKGKNKWRFILKKKSNNKEKPGVNTSGFETSKQSLKLTAGIDNYYKAN